MNDNVVFDFRKSDWEASFREKSEVISTAEMVCCRRIVELCQHMITAGYYYHCVSCPKSQAKQRRLAKKKKLMAIFGSCRTI